MSITKPKSAQDEVVFARAFDTGQRYLSIRAKLQDQYWLVNNKEFREACQNCHDFIDRYVRLALSRKQAGKIATGDVKNKSHYVFLDELAEQTQDPIELRSQLLHTLLAGRDTTASLLGWLFFLLARSETIYNRLRAAIVEDFGERFDAEQMTFARLKGCRYLQDCLKEALRLYPVVPVNVRAASKDATLPSGGGPDGTQKMFVKKGQDVIYSVYVMHRDEKLWGPVSSFCYWDERIRPAKGASADCPRVPARALGDPEARLLLHPFQCWTSSLSRPTVRSHVRSVCYCAHNAALRQARES